MSGIASPLRVITVQNASHDLSKVASYDSPKLIQGEVADVDPLPIENGFQLSLN